MGDIYQRFSGPEEGRVENIIKFSIPFILEQGQLPLPAEARMQLHTHAASQGAQIGVS